MSAGIIVAGWDKTDGPSVYSIPLGGSLHKQPFAIGGSGSTYIYGYCDSVWKDDMTKEEAVEFTKNGINTATHSFIRYSYNCIICTILLLLVCYSFSRESCNEQRWKLRWSY